MTLDDPQATVVTATTQPLISSVRIIDVAIPFGSLVVLIVKWTLAAIPALLILTIIGLFVAAFFGALFAGLT